MRLLVLFRFQDAFLLHLTTTQIVQIGLLRAETFTNILAQGTKQKAAFRIRVLRVLRVSPISWSTLPRARPEMNCNLTACLGYVESIYLAKLRRKVQVITYSQLCQRFCQRFSRCKQWQCNAVVAFVRQH